jgi:hypothetical protein
LVHAIPYAALQRGLLTVEKKGKKNIYSGRILEIEKFVEMDIEGRKMRGRVDRIDDLGKELQVIDYKSSRNKTSKPELKKDFQMGIYKSAVEAMTGRPVGSVGHWYLRMDQEWMIELGDGELDAIKKRVTKPLKGFKVAPYYGCQIVRPYATFDDQQNPVTMDKLFKALGAEVVPYPLKTRCCGGSLTGTVTEVGQNMSYVLLREAMRRGANVLATTCPLCQFNLDAYQGDISSNYQQPVKMPIVYFTQLMGLAFGISAEKLGLQRCIVPMELQPATA